MNNAKLSSLPCDIEKKCDENNENKSPQYDRNHKHHDPHRHLTPSQIETYLRDGVLVLPNVLSPKQLDDARIGLHNNLLHQHGVDPDDLRRTGHNLQKLSSTNGSGGVLDIFYPQFKMDVGTNEKIFEVTSQLWETAYCHKGETEDEMIDTNDYFMYHPFGSFDCDRGYMYIDRIGYRLPTKLAQDIGNQIHTSEQKDGSNLQRKQQHHIQTLSPTPTNTSITSQPHADGAHTLPGEDNNNINGESQLPAGSATYEPPKKTKKRHKQKRPKQKQKQNQQPQPQPQPQKHKVGKNKNKNKKQRSIQRSLTPHLDCCPETIHSSPDTKTMWRPIQCFVSLTDNPTPNTGGFEAAPGFHRTFHEWARDRSRSLRTAGTNRSNNSSAACDDNGGAAVDDADADGATTTNGTLGGENKSQRQEKAPLQQQIPPPCIGEYTHIRPREDRDIMDRVKHIPVSAGDAVFWDNRLPHSNSYRNDGVVPRAVVYCSFLPDVAVNRRYAEGQLEDWRLRRLPRSMWINVVDDEQVETCGDGEEEYVFSQLGRKLIGIDEW